MIPQHFLFNYAEALQTARAKREGYPSAPKFPAVCPIEAGGLYSLPYTFLSSYACYFFTPSSPEGGIDPYHWSGIAEPFLGIHVVQTSPSEVVVGSSQDLSSKLLDYVKDVLGLWHEQFAPPQDPVVESLAQEYPGIRIPRLSQNLADVLLAVLCSGHTTISNGRRWFLFLKEFTREALSLQEVAPRDMMEQSKQVSGASMGYRARCVRDAVSDLNRNGLSPEDQLTEILASRPAEEVRRSLLEIRYVGAKTADCFLLNTSGDTSIPPVDVNVERACSRTLILSRSLCLPQLSFCKRFVCSLDSSPMCPKFEETFHALHGEAEGGDAVACTRAALKAEFKDAGWVQSLLFLHGIEFCRAVDPDCKNCKISSRCPGPPFLPPTRRSSARYSWKLVEPMTADQQVDLPELFGLYPEKREAVTVKTRQLIDVLRSTKFNATKKAAYAISLCIAARQESVPLTLREAEKFFNLKKDLLFRQIQQAVQILSVPLIILKPRDHLEALKRGFKMSPEEESSATSIADLAFRPGMSPLPLAGASVLEALRINGRSITMKEVSRAIDMTDVTLRKYRDIVQDALRAQAGTERQMQESRDRAVAPQI